MVMAVRLLSLRNRDGSLISNIAQLQRSTRLRVANFGAVSLPGKCCGRAVHMRREVTHPAIGELMKLDI